MRPLTRSTILAAFLLAATGGQASAQGLRDRVLDRCLQARDEAACTAALDLLWPILVEMSAEPGEVLLQAPGEGAMTTAAFQNTSPSLRVDWTLDARSSQAGCSLDLRLWPLSPGDERPILSAVAAAGQTESGTGWVHTVPLDQFAIRQAIPGDCFWSVTVTGQ